MGAARLSLYSYPTPYAQLAQPDPLELALKARGAGGEVKREGSEMTTVGRLGGPAAVREQPRAPDVSLRRCSPLRRAGGLHAHGGGSQAERRVEGALGWNRLC